MYVSCYTVVTVDDTTKADEDRLRQMADAHGADDWRSYRNDETCTIDDD